MKKAILSFISAIVLAACSGGESISDSAAINHDRDTAIAADEERLSTSIAQSADTLTFAFAGDVMMGTTYPELQLPAEDGAHIFDDVADLFRTADVAAINLEGVLLDGPGEPKGQEVGRTFYFKMPEAYVRHLTDIGIDFASIANNHSNDFGAPGRESTQRVLSEAGIAYAGLRDVCPTAIIERGGHKIGFTAFGFSLNDQSINDYDLLRRLVSHLDSVCDIVVVSFHGGGEGPQYTHVPKAVEVYSRYGNRGDVHKFAHEAIDAGADIVYGHSPHVTRAMELYRDRIIAYSLGNFATPYGMNVADLSGHAPLLTVRTDADGRFIDGRIHSFIQQRGVGPRRDATNIVAAHIRSLTLADFPDTPLTISPDGALGRK